ncbi:MAG: bifunctional oligoribonuclease/PAP phosphatase NrnA [Acidobacteria bacterium]|nr:bifunctional oligoribonuclease/PAP phosphatase NrnA [Acidobacteriota bacterium]
MNGSATDVAAAIRRHDVFLITSHARPDGDAIGSQLAMAFALDTLGKRVRLVNHDPVPGAYRSFPGADRIVVAPEAPHLPDLPVGAEATIVMECGDLARSEVTGLERPTVINIDHHIGNTMFGSVNWFDGSAASCAEMVADVIDALGVAWTQDIAAHLYLGIVTDTGGFRHGPISARTFHASARIAATGVSPALLSREIFDSFGVGRIRLTGALLNSMELHHNNRLAVLYYDDEILAACGATSDDTDGLVNLPLGAKDVLAVALVRKQTDTQYRVSMRSKGSVSVRDVAVAHGGGGHTNAAACSIAGSRMSVTSAIVAAIAIALP